MAFFIASSPHLRSKRSTADVMRWVLACALPGLIAQTYFFGYGTLIQLLLAISVAVALEAGIMLLRKRSPISALRASLSEHSGKKQRGGTQGDSRSLSRPSHHGGSS